VPVEKEIKPDDEDDQIPPEIVASDFIARKQAPYDARRKFILNYCLNESDTTAETETDKKKQKRLCDDDLMKKDLEVRL